MKHLDDSTQINNIYFITSIFLIHFIFVNPDTSLAKQSGAAKSSTGISKGTAKGLLPELRTNTEDENLNEQRAFSSEVLITRTEQKAISALENILQRKKGTPEEPDLWYRLAELHMRRSKSGRFFDMNLNEKTKRWSPFPIPNEKGIDSVRRAVKIYNHIEEKFPKFTQMDEVLFTLGFAYQQLNLQNAAVQSYKDLKIRYPNSRLIPDGTLALGEILYDRGDFKGALSEFLSIEKYPKSRVYNYGFYKAAWTYYNLNQSKSAVEMLVRVVRASPPPSQANEITSPDDLPKQKLTSSSKQNLRKEALRDLAVFTTDTFGIGSLYGFFKDLCTQEELGEAMVQIGKIFVSHSKYKEAIELLSTFRKEEDMNPSLIDSQLLLVESYESIKERNKVVQTLTDISKTCSVDSDWFKLQSPENFAQACQKNFRGTSLEIAKKWWEIWLKNRQNRDFSQLTESALRLLLDNEDPKNPDVKTHYALAELLFQTEKYPEASHHYKFTGLHSQDPQIAHDANYAALYSIEKQIEKTKDNKEFQPQRRELALTYLEKHPKGVHASAVKFNLGLVAYEANDYPEAQKWLIPLSQDKNSSTFQVKAEDLLLDIANLQKNYQSLKELSSRILANKTTDDRRLKVQKILEESSFKEIQESIQPKQSTPEQEAALVKLIEFGDKHPKSPLARDALWQSLSLAFSMGKSVQGADLSMKFAHQNKSDSKAIDAAKEAAAQYAQVGYFLKAAETLLWLAENDPNNRSKYIEPAADFLALENQGVQARDLYQQLLKNVEKSKSGLIISKILHTFKIEEKTKGNKARIKNELNPEIQKLQEKILALNIEPQATEIWMERAQKQLDQGHLREAFDLSLKINNRSVDKEYRAPARLIQAKILEKELIEQSLKVQNPERLNIVLNLKSEKFEKAHTAYLSTVQMTQNPETLFTALNGLDRVYTNFIESLKSLPLLQTLASSEKMALQGELNKITLPIEEKRKENLTKLQNLRKTMGQMGANESPTPIWDFPIEHSAKIPITYPSPEKFREIIPNKKHWNFAEDSPEIKSKGSLCEEKQFTTQSLLDKGAAFLASECYLTKKWNLFGKATQILLEDPETRVQGLYFQSLRAEKEQNLEKAQYIIELALKSQKENPYLLYQKGRILYKNASMQAAFPFFEKLFNMEKKSTELETLEGIKLFSADDFTGAAVKFAALSVEEIYNLGVGSMVAEAFAQSGQIDKAMNLIEKLLAVENKPEFYVVKARLLETYKTNHVLALESYKKANTQATGQVQLSDWLERKIKFLNTQVVRQVSSGDSGE